jgi:hypothetical protein
VGLRFKIAECLWLFNQRFLNSTFLKTIKFSQLIPIRFQSGVDDEAEALASLPLRKG